MARCLIPLLALALAACGEPVPADRELPDGIYEVMAVASSPSELPAERAGTKILEYDWSYVRGGEDLPAQHVLLRRDGYTPLERASAAGRPACLDVSIASEPAPVIGAPAPPAH